MVRRLGTWMVVAVILLSGGVAYAQDTVSFLGGKFRAGDTLVIDDTAGDVYAFGGEVRVDGTVTGDLVVSAGTVVISGTVDGDVVALTGDLQVTGRVEGDLRAAAGQVVVSGEVGEDVLLAAGRLDVQGEVVEDLIFGAGQVTLAGRVAGDVLGSAGSYTRTGTVVGTEQVSIDQPAEEQRRTPLSRAVGRFASAFLVGLGLLAYRRSRWVDATIAQLSDAPGPTVGWGVLFLVSLGGIPLGTLVVGVLLGLFFGWLGLGPLAAATVFAVIVSWAVVAFAGVVMVALLAPVTVGTWLAARFMPDTTPIYLAMAAGVAVLALLGLVPVLGALVGLGVTVLGGGSWVRSVWSHRRRLVSTQIAES